MDNVSLAVVCTVLVYNLVLQIANPCALGRETCMSTKEGNG